jgi:FAD/FMN-containing dehydrogenase
LTCDHLVEAQIVTADGRLRTCSERKNSDLFWALRGGGGGNFGVCTSYTFATNPVSSVTLYDISWDWADAPAVFEAFQHVIQSAPDEF